MIHLTDCDLMGNERIYFLTERSVFYYEIIYSKVSLKGSFNLHKRKELAGFKADDSGNFVDFMSQDKSGLNNEIYILTA